MTNSPSENRAAMAFILVTIVLDVIAMGIIIPVLPPLIVRFSAGDTAKAAEIYGLFGTAWALMQFLFAPVLGAISDRFGRRKVLLISCFGLCLDYLLMGIAPNLRWLFVGRVLSGITAASFSTAFAYIADTTPPERRAASFGMAGAAFGLGFVLGPALGGLLGASHPRLPFFVAAGMALLSGLYGLFVLPESLPPEKRTPFRWSRANPVGALSLVKRYPALLSLVAVSMLFQLAHYVLPSCMVLYTRHRYGFGERMVGLTMASVGLCSGLVQGVLVRRLVPKFGERVTLLLGLGFGVLGYFGYGFARTGLEFFVALPIFALMGLFGPSLQGLMTQRVDPGEQGKLQGLNSSLMGIMGLVGPGLYTQTFSYSIGNQAGFYLPGAPFFLASALLLLGLLVASGTRPKAPLPASSGS